ncbi:unnamed protein product [Euphydryas editha]|uniref:Uncharacterized protein n=1 Tax=Euphydryas editha TaxID=104508 RepID=A0AAU9V3Z8_EUPED|nr:unnamed protein product [Euphydryas editha]
MDDKSKQNLGYSTKNALIKLRDDIRTVIEEHKQNNRMGLSIIQNIISFTSEKVLLSGIAYTVTIINIICLILTYLFGETLLAQGYLLWEALFLFILLVINFLLAFNEEYIYNNEIPHRVKKVLETIDEAIKKCQWKENHYPHLCAPFSPCVILQWTYRDGVIVNLPWALLVEGDIIVLRPGQEAPGHCRGLEPDDPELFFGQIFLSGSQAKEHFSVPRVRAPHPNKEYKMCETPFLKNLKLALEQATTRPVTVFEKQRYLCTVKILEGIVLPFVILVMVVTSLIRYLYHLPGVTHWTEVYFLQIIAASLPLLQIVFPIAWVTLNCYGLARFKLLSETGQKYSRPKSCSISEDASDPLIQALSETNLKPQALRTLGRTFWNILIGREDMVTRTANIVHVLGSLSALCCVDKKGILSWPNPTAEKVFFLRNSSPLSHNSSKTSLIGSMGHQSQMNLDQDDEVKQNPEPTTIVEVLDLTHDQNAPFRVEFDEQRWRTHLARLKPLGLAALLNTCARAPRHTYAHFCAHLTCEAHHSEDLVPVTNRRCLCELAKQIGFTDTVAESYNVQECLAVFRHLQADTIRRETRFVRSLHLSTRVKVPLPHMLAVIVKDQSNQLQMLTQGTADIILDSCVDYWNGRDLTPLSASDRKKIIDFYQRNSLTAYCTAFAYKPLTRGISHALASQYLELPADSRALYAHVAQRAPAPAWDAAALHFHSSGTCPTCPNTALYAHVAQRAAAPAWDAAALHFHSSGTCPTCPNTALYAHVAQRAPAPAWDAAALHFHSSGTCPTCPNTALYAHVAQRAPAPAWDAAALHFHSSGTCPTCPNTALYAHVAQRAAAPAWDAAALHFHSSGTCPTCPNTALYAHVAQRAPAPAWDAAALHFHSSGTCPTCPNTALYAHVAQRAPAPAWDAAALHFHSSGTCPTCPNTALYAHVAQRAPAPAWDAAALHFHSSGTCPTCPNTALYAHVAQRAPAPAWDAAALHFHSSGTCPTCPNTALYAHVAQRAPAPAWDAAALHFHSSGTCPTCPNTALYAHVAQRAAAPAWDAAALHFHSSGTCPTCPNTALYAHVAQRAPAPAWDAAALHFHSSGTCPTCPNTALYAHVAQRAPAPAWDAAALHFHSSGTCPTCPNTALYAHVAQRAAAPAWDAAALHFHSSGTCPTCPNTALYAHVAQRAPAPAWDAAALHFHSSGTCPTCPNTALYAHVAQRAPAPAWDAAALHFHSSGTCPTCPNTALYAHVAQRAPAPAWDAAALHFHSSGTCPTCPNTALYAHVAQRAPAPAWDAAALHFHSSGTCPTCPNTALYAHVAQRAPAPAWDAAALHFHSSGTCPTCPNTALYAHVAQRAPAPAWDAAALHFHSSGTCPTCPNTALYAHVAQRAAAPAWDAAALHFHSSGTCPTCPNTALYAHVAQRAPAPAWDAAALHFHSSGTCPTCPNTALYAHVAQRAPAPAWDAAALHFHSSGTCPTCPNTALYAHVAQRAPAPAWDAAALHFHSSGTCPTCPNTALYAHVAQRAPAPAWDAAALHFHSSGTCPTCPNTALYAHVAQRAPAPAWDAAALHFHSSGTCPTCPNTALYAHVAQRAPAPAWDAAALHFHSSGTCPTCPNTALYAHVAQRAPAPAWDAAALHFHSSDSLLFNEVTDDDVSDADGYFDMQCNQVFIGMVTMQYQAQSDMVELIERLERACIRFVHFSKENELRSRVFSEKMGLESGWNCHISLMSDHHHSKPASPLSSQTLRGRHNTASQLTRPDTGDAFIFSGTISSSKALSMSAPGAINVEHNTVKFDDEVKKTRHSITTHSGIKLQRGSESRTSTDSLLGAESPPDACRSLSCLTDSTDHTAPLNFDMSNRAKLPRGIENIRPHIEQVDNVPLLVSLFTDCTASSVQRMIQIMQDYNEVVCVMGSAANCQNMEIFMQADASIAVEPLYPVLCQKMPPYQVPRDCIGPIDLARSLNSVPCSLSMSRDADVSLFALITMSRHFTMCLWNSTQFWICSSCFLSLLQVGSVVCVGAGALSPGGAVAGSLAGALLAAALSFAPPHAALVLRAATRPALAFSARMAVFVFWCYACKFLPSALSILILYGFTLRSFCEQIATFTNTTSCWLMYPVNVGNYSSSQDLSLKSWHGWGDDFYDGFYLAQHITLALITLHLIVISMSFIHRHSSIWQARFWTNWVWCVTVVFLLVGQSGFSAAMLSASYGGGCAAHGACALRYAVRAPLLAAYAASLLLAFALNELIKWQELKVDARNQRRARLDFGTKLGMNSPF